MLTNNPKASQSINATAHIKPKASRISSTSSTPLLLAQQNPLGSKPSNVASSNLGQVSPQQPYEKIYSHPKQQPRATSIKLEKTYEQPRKQFPLTTTLTPSQHKTLTTRRRTSFLPPSLIQDESTPTKPVASLSPPVKATNTFWSCTTTTRTPSSQNR
jgi:hypothetical protein